MESRYFFCCEIMNVTRTADNLHDIGLALYLVQGNTQVNNSTYLQITGYNWNFDPLPEINGYQKDIVMSRHPCAQFRQRRLFFVVNGSFCGCMTHKSFCINWIRGYVFICFILLWLAIVYYNLRLVDSLATILVYLAGNCGLVSLVQINDPDVLGNM